MAKKLIFQKILTNQKIKSKCFINKTFGSYRYVHGWDSR